MAFYKVFRLKENLRPHFRQLPHLSGVTQLKLKDYVEAIEVEAAHRYAAWFQLRGTCDPLEVGDVLAEGGGTNLFVVKFVGLEQAEWIVPELKPEQVEFLKPKPENTPVGA